MMLLGLVLVSVVLRAIVCPCGIGLVPAKVCHESWRIPNDLCRGKGFAETQIKFGSIH